MCTTAEVIPFVSRKDAKIKKGTAQPIDVTKFEQLKAVGDLPSPKGVALAIIRLVQQEDSSIGELARVTFEGDGKPIKSVSIELHA